MARRIDLGIVLKNVNMSHKNLFATVTRDVHVLKKRLEVVVILYLVFIKDGIITPQDLVARDTPDGKHIFFIRSWNKKFGSSFLSVYDTVM
jgi:hypothetical protein